MLFRVTMKGNQGSHSTATKVKGSLMNPHLNGNFPSTLFQSIRELDTEYKALLQKQVFHDLNIKVILS